MASDNGVVVKLLDTNGDGITDALDTTGDGQPDEFTAPGLADPVQFRPNATFWRIKVDHFTPWDFNWPEAGLPGDAVGPNPDGEPIVDQQKKKDPPQFVTCGTGNADEKRIVLRAPDSRRS